MENTWMLKGEKNGDKIVFLSPHDDPDRYRVGTRKGREWEINLGIIFLATYLEQFDWKFEPAKKIKVNGLSKICRDAFVGISTLPSNYRVGIEIADIIKPVAKLVVMGGPYATTRATQILHNQFSIGCVVVGAGEIPFAKIVSGKKFETIEGVAYRKRSDIVLNPPLYFPLNERPVPNRNLWSIKKEGTVVYWQDGCPFALVGKQCVFCTIQHCGLSRRTVDQVIAEMKTLAVVGCYGLEDGGDDFATGGRHTIEWLDKLANESPSNFKWLIHTSTRSLTTRGIIPALAKVGVRVVQVGFETGDPQKKIKHKTEVRIEERVIAELMDCGIKIYGAWIIGLSGEDEKSLSQTVKQVTELYQREVLCGVMFEPLWPGPGSPAFTMLCRIHPEWTEKDFIEPEELLNAWFKEYTKITLEQALKIKRELLEQINVPIIGGMLL